LQYWPIVPAPASISPPAGVTATLGVLNRSDGSKQLTVNGMPVYTYAGDTTAGRKMSVRTRPERRTRAKRNTAISKGSIVQSGKPRRKNPSFTRIVRKLWELASSLKLASPTKGLLLPGCQLNTDRDRPNIAGPSTTTIAATSSGPT